MKFQTDLIKARLIKRYKRFLADIQFDDGTITTIHCPNPGAMTGLAAPDSTIWVSPANNPKRKLKYTWELIEVGDSLVGINTNLPNAIVEEAINQQGITELADYETLTREVKYGQNSRIDILLQSEGMPPCYVEIKNVHLCRTPNLAEFPDSVTSRGTKHLQELSNMVDAGNRAVMLYLVQRMDNTRMTIADDIDPTYAQAFKKAQENGVEMLCYDCAITPEEITLRDPLKVI